jgi:predicted XRE-type DNA-binding protein
MFGACAILQPRRLRRRRRGFSGLAGGVPSFTCDDLLAAIDLVEGGDQKAIANLLGVGQSAISVALRGRCKSASTLYYARRAGLPDPSKYVSPRRAAGGKEFLPGRLQEQAVQRRAREKREENEARKEAKAAAKNVKRRERKRVTEYRAAQRKKTKLSDCRDLMESLRLHGTYTGVAKEFSVGVSTVSKFMDTKCKEYHPEMRQIFIERAGEKGAVLPKLFSR